jgi:hypothetical protein
MNDYKPLSVGIKSIEMRLASVKESIQRTRFVFIVTTIASTAIIFTLWNASYSRDRTMAFGQRFRPQVLSNVNDPCEILELASQTEPQPSLTPNDKRELPHEHGKRVLLEEWYKSRSIQVDLLGIHLSVSDLPVIGSFTLVIITIWFFYAQRRENRALVTLLQDVHKEHRNDLEVRKLVFHEIKNSLLFIKTEEGDEPLRGLHSERKISQSSPSTSSKKGQGTTVDPEDSIETPKEKKTLTTRILDILSYLSFWTIVAIIVRDVIALFMYSPTSGMDLRLGQILLLETRCKLKNGFDFFTAGHSIILLVLFESVAILCGIYTWHLCKRCRAFSRANKETLQQFGRVLMQDINKVNKKLP